MRGEEAGTGWSSCEQVMAKLLEVCLGQGGWSSPPLWSAVVGSLRDLWPDVLSVVAWNVQQVEAVDLLRGHPPT